MLAAKCMGQALSAFARGMGAIDFQPAPNYLLNSFLLSMAPVLNSLAPELVDRVINPKGDVLEPPVLKPPVLKPGGEGGASGLRRDVRSGR